MWFLINATLLCTHIRTNQTNLPQQLLLLLPITAACSELQQQQQQPQQQQQQQQRRRVKSKRTPTLSPFLSLALTSHMLSALKLKHVVRCCRTLLS